jgi:site-specific recombinase XerD
VSLAFPAPTFGHAAEAFIIAHAAPGAWSAGTAVKYRQTLAALGASALEAAFTSAFGGLAPATRARHLSALRSALAWWAEAGWLDSDPTTGWARPKVPVDTTRALTRAQVASIWKLDVPLRDRALWRMLYETAARAEEILGLDVPDLDLPSKRGRVISKGGTTDWVHWHCDAAAPAAGRAARGPGVPDRPQAGPRGRLWRLVPGHQASEAVLPAGR